MCSSPGLPKLPRPQAQKSAGAIDVAEKVKVDSTAPPGAPVSKPQVGIGKSGMYVNLHCLQSHADI